MINEITTPKEWGDQEHKNCFAALQNMCMQDGNTQTLDQIEQMVAGLGADYAHSLCMGKGNGLPDDVKAIMLKVFRYVQYKQSITKA